MPVNGLDHVNIRTKDAVATTAFYAAALGLRPGSERASWLCDDAGQAIVHLWPQDEAPDPGGPVHHVALTCSDLPAATARLDAARIDYRVSDRAGFTQVFVHDPNGVMLELNFRGE